MDKARQLFLGEFRLAWDLWRGERFVTLGHYLNDVPAKIAAAEKAAGRHFESLAQEAEEAGRPEEARRLRAIRITVRADADASRGEGGLLDTVYQNGQLVKVIETINPRQKTETIKVVTEHELVHLEREAQFQASLQKWTGLLGLFLGTLFAKAIEEVGATRETRRRLRQADSLPLQSLSKVAQTARSAPATTVAAIQDQVLSDMTPASNYGIFTAFLDSLRHHCEVLIAGARDIASAA